MRLCSDWARGSLEPLPPSDPALTCHGDCRAFDIYPAVALADLEAEVVGARVLELQVLQQQVAHSELRIPHQLGAALEAGLHQLGACRVNHYLPFAGVVIVPDGCDVMGHIHTGREAEGARDDEAGPLYTPHGVGTGDAPRGQA